MWLDYITLRMGIYGDGVPTPTPTYVPPPPSGDLKVFLGGNRYVSGVPKKKIKIPEGGVLLFFNWSPRKKISKSTTYFF